MEYSPESSPEPPRWSPEQAREMDNTQSQDEQLSLADHDLEMSGMDMPTDISAQNSSTKDSVYVPPGMRLVSNECSICQEPFKIPLITPCGHVFCQECIVSWYRVGKRTSRTVTCPNCREELWCPLVDEGKGEDQGEDPTPDFGGYGRHHDAHEDPAEVRNWDTLLELIEATQIHTGKLKVANDIAIGVGDEYWREDVAAAMHFFLSPGPAQIGSAPTRIYGTQAARDVVILGNLLLPLYVDRIKTVSRCNPFLSPRFFELDLHDGWHKVVTACAQLLMRDDWEGQEATASELQEAILDALVVICDKDLKPPIYDAFFADPNHDNPGLSEMLDKLTNHIVSRAVRFRLSNIVSTLPSQRFLLKEGDGNSAARNA